MEKKVIELDDAKREELDALFKPGYAAGLVPGGVTRLELAEYLAGKVAKAKAPFDFKAGFASGIRFALMAEDDEVDLTVYAECSFVAHALIAIKANLDDAMEAESDD